MIETRNTELKKTIKDAFNLLVLKYGWERICADEVCASDNLRIDYEDDVFDINVRPAFVIQPGGKSLNMTVSYADTSAVISLMEALCRSSYVSMKTYFDVMDSFASEAVEHALLENHFETMKQGKLTYALGYVPEKYEMSESLAGDLNRAKESLLWNFLEHVQGYCDKCEASKEDR